MTQTRPTSNVNEAAFLQKIFLYAFALRGVAVFVLNNVAQLGLGMLADDGATYHYAGMWMMYHWSSGVQYPEFVERILANHWGYVYFVGAIYYALGEVPLLIQFTSAFFGACIPLVIYRIAKLLFDQEVAMKSARFAAFLPSMIIWSAQILRDPLIALLICLAIYAALKLMERFQVADLVLLLSALLVLYSLRFYIVALLFGCLVFAFAFGRGYFVGGTAKRIGVGLILIVVAVYGGFYQGMAERIGDNPLERMQQNRKDLTVDAGSAFTAIAESDAPEAAVSKLPTGLVYFLLSPFPWQMGSLRALLSAPEMLLWWWLIPVTLQGFRRALLLRPRQCLLIVSFIIVMSLFYALIVGNAGIAYRYRAQIVCLIFIFTSFELVARQRQRLQRAHPRQPMARRASGVAR